MSIHPHNNYSDINNNALPVVSKSMTKEQLRRVDEAFVELFHYPFEYSDTKYQRNVGHPAATTKSQKIHADNPIKDCDDNTMVPPKWLYTIMGNSNKHSMQVWNQLSKEQKLRLSTNEIMHLTTTKQRRRSQFHSFVPKRQYLRRLQQSQSNPDDTNSNNTAQRSSGVEMVSTHRTSSTSTATTQSTMLSSSPAAPTGTNFNTSNRPGGMDRLLETIQDEQKKTTIIKRTHDNWEYYKDSIQSRDTIEQYSTTNQAFLPQQEFKHRVQLRQYDLEKRNK